jgi:hypothetical protein
MRETIGHEVLAGAIGSASILGGAFTSPLLAPVVDLASATLTAGVATHAAFSSARERGVSARRVLRGAVRRSVDHPGAPLAAHVIEAATRARALDARALRSIAMLVGRAFDAHARGLAIGVFAPWCTPLRRASRLMDTASAARAGLANAELVRAMGEEAAALEVSARAGEAQAIEWFPMSVDADELARDEAPPASGRFPIATDADALETVLESMEAA